MLHLLAFKIVVEFCTCVPLFLVVILMYIVSNTTLGTFLVTVICIDNLVEAHYIFTFDMLLPFVSNNGLSCNNGCHRGWRER